MQIVRFQSAAGQIHQGTLLPGGALALVQTDARGGFAQTGETLPPQAGRYLPPVEVTAIVGIGLNYRQHAAELGVPLPKFPVCFFKLPTSAQGHLEAIRIPREPLASHKVDYECELAVILGRPARNVCAADAHLYIAGYTCANDVSARDWQLEHGGSQWCRGKMFDTFCPLGPCLVTPDELPHPEQLRLETRVNGVTLQSGNTADMAFGINELIAFLSAETTLPAGTVILTGTPQGVGMSRKPPQFLQPGDEVEIEIEGIGVLRNPVE